MDGPAGRGVHRLLLLPDAAAHGNLWFAVGFHAAWDWGETFFYSVPDSGMVSPGHLLSSSLRGADWLSGGSVGPEGSVLCFVVIAVAWIVFEKMYPTAVVRGDHGNGAVRVSPAFLRFANPGRTLRVKIFCRFERALRNEELESHVPVWELGNQKSSGRNPRFPARPILTP